MLLVNYTLYIDIMSTRIDYIDSLKGVVMLCVVYWHISIYTGATDSPVNLIYMPFYMTLFFS